MEELNRQCIPTTIGSCSEIYRKKAFGWTKRLPNASRLQETSLGCQVHPKPRTEHMRAVGTAAKGIPSRGQ